jgi:hypothetical protein
MTSLQVRVVMDADEYIEAMGTVGFRSKRSNDHVPD